MCRQNSCIGVHLHLPEGYRAFFVNDQQVETLDDPAEALQAIPRHSFAYTTAIVTAA
jgi:hypothetical protein